MQCIDGLVYSYKEMLGKVMTQKTQQFLAFLCYQEKQKKKCWQKGFNVNS